MSERPILFSAPMIRALLAGTKTQTRRVVKDTGLYAVDAGIHGQDVAARELLALATRCPYGRPGDRLWCRETHMDLGACYLYRADPGAETERTLVAPGQPWKPAIHMPRAASRITLKVVGVRVERLQDISRGDAMAEGCPFANMAAGPDPRDWYRDLWTEINGAGAWDANPFVWCVSFRRTNG